MNKYAAIILSAMTGFLFAVILPSWDFGLSIWITFVPLFMALSHARPGSAAIRGLVAGILAALLVNMMLMRVLLTKTGSYAAAIIVVGLVEFYCVVYWVVWAAAVTYVKDDSAWFAPFAAALWVLTEYARRYLIHVNMYAGYNWGFLGYSQTGFTQFIQIAEYAGVFGISFLIMLVNASIYQAARYRKILPLVIALLITGGVVWQGKRLQEANRRETSQRSVRVAIVQGNIDQERKWKPQFRSEILTTHKDLVLKALKESPEVIIWPETALPGPVPLDEKLTGWLKDLVKSTRVWHIVGILYKDGHGASYNASIAMDPEGNVTGMHKKTRLLVFGEYLPLRSMMQRISTLANGVPKLMTGAEPEVLRVKDLGWGPALCSEDSIGALGHSTNKGANIIVTQSNNGDYGYDDVMIDIHFGQSIFRAIEYRRPVIDAANTGITAVVSPAGDVIEKLPAHEKGYLISEVHPRQTMTLYARFGDWFVAVCGLFCILAIGREWYGRHRRRMVA